MSELVPLLACHLQTVSDSYKPREEIAYALVAVGHDGDGQPGSVIAIGQ